MIVHDISRELFSSVIYPGDRVPTFRRTSSIRNGDAYNLSEIAMCVHNGTHIDAPSHYIDSGITIDQVALTKCIGPATVVQYDETIHLDNLYQLLNNCHKRLLIKGSAEISLDMAKMIVQHSIELIGTESLSVGSKNDIDETHIELLKNEIIILENINLDNVPEGNYFLFAAPVKWGGLEGAPCRALLIEEMCQSK